MAFPKFSLFSKSTILAIGIIAGSAPVGVSVATASDTKAAQALHIVIDRAKVVRIAKAADTIIVGNPSIVDATIQDARTIVLTGRNFGVTNLIVLDADGDAIVDETVIVKSHERNIVRVYRQSVRETLSCSPVCESTLTIGDSKEGFSSINSQIQARNSLAEANSGQ
jgi:Flp pilus assembly secretin CpaC